MILTLKQIYLPSPNPDNRHVTYENQLQPRMTFADVSLKALFARYEPEILNDVVREITDYVNADDVCNNDVDMFPRRCELTGEWYIGSIYFEDNFLSVTTHFLGHHPNPPFIDDYLELDVVFLYDKDLEQFIFNGINSACI